MAIGNFYSPYQLAYNSWNTTRAARSNYGTKTTTRYAPGSTTGSVIRKRTSVPHKKTFASKVRKLTPARHVNVGDNVATFNLLHNTLFTWNLLANVTSGAATENQRGSNSIYLEAVKFSMFVESPVTINAISIRIMILYHDDYFDNSAPSASGLTRGEIGIGTTGNERTTCMIPDPRKCTIVDDRKFQMIIPVENARDTIPIDYTVQLKKNFLFQTSGTTEGKLKNLYCVITANQVNSINGTNIGIMKPNMDLIFRE